MSWFKKDDKIYDSPKFLAAGLFGRALWDAAGVKCSGRNTDGIVDPFTVRHAAFAAGLMDDPELGALTGGKFPRVEDIVAKLVKVGLWHDAKTLRRCARCTQATGGKLEADHYYFHDWIEYQLTAASQVSDESKWKDARRRRLMRNKRLREEIRERDGTLCRYCAKRVDFDDHRSDAGGTYDHIDPDKDNSLDNVCVACRGCNTAKGERTPEEAGMRLLPAGTARPAIKLAEPIPIQPASDPGTGNIQSGIGTDSDRTETEPETDRVETETEPNRDSVSRAPDAQGGTGPERFESGFEPELETDRIGDGGGSGQHGDGVGSGPGNGPGPVSAETESDLHHDGDKPDEAAS